MARRGGGLTKPTSWNLVRGKSGSNKLRGEVKFCLNADDTADTADGLASFYSEYVEQVLTS